VIFSALIVSGCTSSTTDEMLTTDILNATNVSLDKKTFTNPNNEEYKTFVVELVKRNNVEIDFMTVTETDFNNMKNQGTSKTIAGFEGHYLKSINTFNFEKNGIYYSVSVYDHEWNSFIDEDVGKLLTAWSEKA
jgi:hypothetical protein